MEEIRLKAVTLEEQISGATLEVAMRHRVYPRLIAAGKMSEKKATYNIAVMQAIVATLESLREPARQGTLL